MRFEDLKVSVGEVKFSTVRFDMADYFEAVFSRESFEMMTNILKNLFGSPIWPSDSGKLSNDIKRALEDFGGVRIGQILYFWQKDDTAVFAMLWPWQDDHNITLKIGSVRLRRSMKKNIQGDFLNIIKSFLKMR